MVKVEISPTYFKFEGELDDLLRHVSDLKGHLGKKHKKALKELLNEINKIYDTIALAVNAFVKIPFRDPDFNKSFAQTRASFQEQYKMDKETVGFRCDKVKEKLDELTKPDRSQGLLAKFFKKDSYSRESMLKLENHINKWYVSDKDVYRSLEELQKHLLARLDEINHILMREGQEEAYSELQSFLEESNQHLDKIKRLQIRLQDISQSL